MKTIKSPLFWQILLPVLLVVVIPTSTLLVIGWFTASQTSNLLAAGAPLEAVEAVLQAMLRFNLFIALLTLLAICFVAYLITTRVVQAVQALQSAAEALEKDSFEEQQLEETTRRKDELGDLARTFREMAGRVTSREERLREEVTRLTIHIDTIQKHDAVAQIVSSDFFKHIEEKARLMRFRRTLAEQSEKNDPEDEKP